MIGTGHGGVPLINEQINYLKLFILMRCVLDKVYLIHENYCGI